MNKLLLTSLSLTLALGACKSTGVDSSAQTAQAMRELMVGLEDAPTRITAVSASLADLAAEGADMKVAFATFSTEVDALISHRDHLRSLKSEVDANKASFQTGWETRSKMIKDEDLRKRAEDRRNAVMAEFAEIAKVSDAGKAEFEPWMQTVLDVRTYLESDLNPAGVASVKDKVDEISAGANSVNDKITIVVTELKKIAKSIAATKADK